MPRDTRQVVRAALALVVATALGLASAQAHRADGATAPRAQSSASLGTLACTDRLNRLTLVRGDGRARRTLKVKGENPIFSPDGSRIALRAVQRGLARTIVPRLLVSDRSGRNVRTVVSLPRSGSPASFEPLTWSGDSTRLAYVRPVQRPGFDEGETTNRLFTADANGGGEYAVPLDGEGVSPPPQDPLEPQDQRDLFVGNAAWSPDGKSLAISASSWDPAANHLKAGIWLADPSSGAARLLLENSSGGLSWSPDGTRLAVYEETRGFFVMDARSAEATRGQPLIGTVWMRWSPDGRRIAVDGSSGVGRRATYDSRVAEADLSRVIDPSRRTPKGFQERQQLWSPDGRQIAFNRTFVGPSPRFKTNEGAERYYRKTQARSGVYVVSARGGTPKRLIGSSPARTHDDDAFHPNELICTDWSRR
jgi:Tol biopolymer transport system component